MALLTTTTATNLKISNYMSWAEEVPYLVGTAGIGSVADLKVAKRIHTSYTSTYVGLDEATAKGYVDAHPATMTESSGTITKVGQCTANPVGDSPMWYVTFDTETIAALTAVL
jgi:hypothetical protein